MINIRKFETHEEAQAIVSDLLAFATVAEVFSCYRYIETSYQAGAWWVIFRKFPHRSPYVLTDRGFVPGDFLTERWVW